MQWLLEQLTKPQILPDGIVRQPTTVMLKAAQVIRELSNLFETDKNGRTKAEQQYIETHGKLVETESLLRIAGSRIAELELSNRSLTDSAKHLVDQVAELNVQLQVANMRLREYDLAPPLETHQCIDLYQQILNEDNIRSLT